MDAETAQRLRLFKADIEEEPLNFAAPDEGADVYGGSMKTVAPDDGE